MLVIESSPVVKLLGVHADYNLSFNYHIHEICRKAGLKLNVLARVSRILDSDTNCFYSIHLLFHNLTYVPLFGITVAGEIC